MSYVVILNEGECYCRLIDFYQNVARKLGLDHVEDLSFDCRKIQTTLITQEKLIAYYKKEEGLSDEEIATVFCNYGPKASLSDETIIPFKAQVDDGFYSMWQINAL